MGTQTANSTPRPKKESEQKPHTEWLPPSADVPEEKTDIEPRPKPWPD